MVDRAMRRIATRIATRNEEDFQKDLDNGFGYLPPGPISISRPTGTRFPGVPEPKNLVLKNRILVKVLHHNL